VVEYGYDAWGKPTRIWSLTHNTDSTLTSEYQKLAQLNPFRYRGYVWDEETGLYYLRSRYYDPSWGRFLNVDSLAGKVGSLLGHNLFAYCVANPVGLIDPDGTIPVGLLIGIVSTIVGGAVLYAAHRRNTSKGMAEQQARVNVDKVRNHSRAIQVAQKFMPLLTAPKHYLCSFDYPIANDDVISTVKSHLDYYGYDVSSAIIVEGINMYACAATNRKTGIISRMAFEVQMNSHRTVWGWVIDGCGAIGAAGTGISGVVAGIDLESMITAIDTAGNIGDKAPYAPPKFYEELEVTRWWKDSVEIWDW